VEQRAVTLIADAVAQGYCDKVYLAVEPDFSAIQSQPELKSLLEQCSEKLKADVE
jgi:hypothetical protein